MDLTKYKFEGSEMNQKLLMGHPSGLFVLFFTEMWERFFYADIGFTLICPPIAFSTFIIVPNCGFAPSDKAL